MNLPDIHLLQAAIMLAEVRNYSRAARKLGIQQPTLTKRILELEHLIGFQLFLRSTQFVEPTEACRQFVEEAKKCVFHAERSVHVARIAEQGAQAVLHIGKSQYTDPYLVSMLSSVSLPLFPNLEVSLSSMSFAELEAEVLLGKLDLAVATGHFENPKITQLELMRTPFYMALPERSPLSEHRELTLSHLNKKSWLLFDRHVHPPLYDSVLRTAAQEGVQPRSIHHVVTAEEAARDLYAGIGEVAFLTRAGAWRIARNGLTMRPLNHPQLMISTKLIARSDDPSRIVSEFARSLKLKLEKPKRIQMDLPLEVRKVS
jgi:DNA-binding transcriptional LysR family regulator